MKPTHILPLAVLMLAVLLLSARCWQTPDPIQGDPVVLEQYSYSHATETSSSGTVTLDSTSFNKPVELTVEDENGTPIPDLSVEYKQEDGVIALRVTDEDNEHAPAYFIADVLSEDVSASGFPYTQSHAGADLTVEPQVVITTTAIGVGLAYAAKAYAVWSLADGLWDMATFHVENVDETSWESTTYLTTGGGAAELLKKTVDVGTAPIALKGKIITGAGKIVAKNALKAGIKDASIAGIQEVLLRFLEHMVGRTVGEETPLRITVHHYRLLERTAATKLLPAFALADMFGDYSGAVEIEVLDTSNTSDPTQPGSVVIDTRFDLKVADYEEQGLFAWRLRRDSDGENGLPSEAVYIAARPKHDRLQLMYMDSGSQFAIDSADTQLFSSYGWVNVRVLDDGSSIRAWLDGTEVLNATFDSSSVEGSYIGFMARESNYGGGNTYIDNVEVTLPSGNSENENFDSGVGSWTVVEGNSTVMNGELNILSTFGNRGMVSFPMEAVSQPIDAAYVFSNSASQSFNRSVTDVTSISALPGPTKDFAAAWYGDRAYIFGGASGPGAYNTTYAYDPASDSYASGTNLPANRRWLEAVTVESEIFVVGGSPDPSASDQAWSYSPASDSFTSIASMNTARSNFALAEVNGDLYAFGGESNGRRRNSAEMYDASADSWSSISNLPSNRYLKYVGAVSHGGYVYLFGGNGGATSTSDTNYAQVYRYDPVADSYSTMTSMPVASGAPLCIPDGDNVLVVIGDTVYRYDITADSWSTEGTLDSSVSGRGAAVASW